MTAIESRPRSPGITYQELLDADTQSGRSASLHLDDVWATYDLAGDCLSAASDAVMASGDTELRGEARVLLEQRLAHENEIMGEWAFVGRS